jgi:hypothetical protein
LVCQPNNQDARLVKHVACLLLHFLCMLNHAYEAWKLALPDEPPYAGTYASTRVAQCFCSTKANTTKALGLNRVATNTPVTPVKTVVIPAFGLLDHCFGNPREVCCMAIGDEFLYRRLGKPRNHPDCRLRSLHIHQGRCNAQRSCAPHFSVSTCSRGRAHVHLNTEVHGTFWGDAAHRAAALVYYKVTRTGISCV